VKVRTHVGKIVDADIEPARHPAQHVANGAVVLAQRPRPSGSVTRENNMHRPSRAHGTLELALAATNLAAVLCSRKLGLHLASENGQLHRHRKLIIALSRGNVVSVKSNVA
jgi:hypothetical protein